MRARAWHHRFALVGGILAGGMPAAAPLAAQQSAPATRRSTPAEDLQLFSQVLNQIRVNHPDSVDTHELFMAAIEGMVRAADPHSYVIAATRLAPEKEKALREGKLVPVPIEFEFIGGAPVVISLAPASAAARLDILPGDELVGAQGGAIVARNVAELEVALAGPKGSDAELIFERRRDDGSWATLRRAVRRERAQEGTAVPAAFLLDSITGYVRLATFEGDRVEGEMGAALARLEKAGMQRLVLDLRDNGGGRVAAAAKIAALFLAAGSLVYTAEGRKLEPDDTVRASRPFWRSRKDYPIVLMVNAGTASASELVAGALQDHDRALIYGRPTFGKALIMRAFPLTDGSVAMLVVGRVRTPCGRLVQREYHRVTTREYYRQARTERELAGRPTCHTDGGRTVYGGGGIFPDVLAPESDGRPLWLVRVLEQDLPLRWTGGYVSAHAAELPQPRAGTAPMLPVGALADFHAFAAAQGVSIPADADADRLLDRLLLRWVAQLRWGDEVSAETAARLDGQVEAARAQFGRAAEVLAARRR